MIFPCIVSTGAPSMRQLVLLAMRCISFDLTPMLRSRMRPGRPVRSRATSHNTTSGPDCRYAAAFLVGALALMPLTASAASCTRKGVELQVLGSGGPELEDKRASTSYLVLQDGRPRIVVDSGGGS